MFLMPVATARSRAADALSFVFGAWKTRPRSKRVLSALSVLLALSGAGMIAYPFVTDLYSSRVQGRLAGEFQSLEFRNQFRSRTVEPGQVLTRIRIPKIGLDALIVEGTDPKALRAGTGHYSGTSLPCERGNTSFAGHRTTYGKPFARLDELVVGDEIHLITPERRCTYRVVDGPRGARPRSGAAGWITHPRDGAVIGSLPGSFTTLTTCHPKGSAKQRLIVRAELVEGS